MIVNGVDLDQYSEITDVTFDNENPHLALVHKEQGGAANGWHNSILTKADDLELKEEVIKALEQITVTLSFEEFLRKFFDMWSSDAELLTKILGYETEYEYYLKEAEADENPKTHSYDEYLEEKVSKFEVMKAAASGQEIPSEDYVSILNLQSTFEKGLMQYDVSFEEEVSPLESESVTKSTDKVDVKTTEKVIANSDHINISKSKEEHSVDVTELMKSAEGQAFLKAEIEKAEAKIAEAKDVELSALTVELEKASGELSTYREEKAARRKEGFTNLVKSLTFVEADDKEGLVEELMKGAEAQPVDMKVIVAQLEKAQEELVKAKEAFITSEEGVELKDEVVEVNKSAELADQVSAKYAGKDFI